MTNGTHSSIPGYADILQPYMPVFYVSFLVTITLTPFMRSLAHRHGVVDDPDNKRKVHTTPIAYLGGISIFLGWLAGMTLSAFLHPHIDKTSTIQVPIGILLGAATVVLFGLMDDVYSLSPRVKLFGQFLAAMLMIVPGVLPILGSNTDFLLGAHKGPAWMILDPLIHIGVLPAEIGESPSHYLLMGTTLFSGAVAIFVIIASCNATNLLDGLDGLCSGVTAVMSVGYLVLAVYLAHNYLANAVNLNPASAAMDPVRITLSLALLGSVLGFLPFNFNPASIFMGDTGSMFLGYICGAMILLFGQYGTVRWFLAAIIMFGLPMMDTFLAIVRRKLNHKHIFSADSNHFHHFLVRRGLTVKRAVLLSYGVAAIFVSFALIIVIVPTLLAIGIYLVLFGWIIVAAFKIGMVFQGTPNVTANTGLDLAVLMPVTVEPAQALTTENEAVKPGISIKTGPVRIEPSTTARVPEPAQIIRS